MNRSWFARRNLPELGKPAEMIEADVVKIIRHPAHPVDPPGISPLLHHVPAIKRIPRALTLCAEKIRRHAGDHFGIEVGLQTKQIGVGPDIGAVKIYEDRDVAHDANRMSRAIGSKRLPLFEEKKLHGAADIEFVEHLRVSLVQRHRIAMSQFAGPAGPPVQFEQGGARGGKKIRERICRRTKVANPAARRQRSGMKQNSAGAREWHSKSILSY